MQVGYLVVDDDLESYLDLYSADDQYVDFEAVEADFAKAAQRAREAGDDIEYMSDMMPVTYEDEASGDTVVRVSIAGMDFQTGAPTAGRLTLHILDEDGEMSLTGKEGRDLRATSSMY